MRGLLVIVTLAMQLAVGMGARPKRDNSTEDGICILKKPLPPPGGSVTCPSQGVILGSVTAYTNLQSEACTTQNQCIDKCWGESFNCQAFSFYADATNPKCTFYSSTLQSQGFDSGNPKADPKMTYSDRLCYGCNCCHGPVHVFLLDKGYFEHPQGAPDTSPWMKDAPPSSSIQAPGVFSTPGHCDQMMTFPSPPTQFGDHRAALAQRLHLCPKSSGKKYHIKFNYRILDPIDSSTLTVYGGPYTGPLTNYPLPTFNPILSITTTNLVPGSWHLAVTPTFTLPNGVDSGYIQFDGYSSGGYERFELDNIRVECAKGK